jgi:two-component system response regulator AdeR
MAEDGGFMSSLVLIADDEGEIVEILDAYMRREGFRTATASDGQQALDLHASLKPDMVLLDVRMPNRDGWDVLGELRRRGTKAKIIFVSGYAEEAFSMNLPDGEEFAFLHKPFTLKQLIEQVKTTLG